MNEEENKNNLPPLPTPEEVERMQEEQNFLSGDQWLDVDTSSLYLDFTKPYKPPRWTLSHDGTPFAKRGDLHVIQGKPGHGKTALMTQFMACLLCGSFGHLRCELKEPPKVLYIDTEMSEDDTIAIKNRVCSLAKIPYDKPSDRFKVVRLRETELAHERWQQILKVIWEQKPTVCFLDGMLDIVEDYNDQKECQPIIRKCMKLVTHYDMSMWCVLHENPMAEKMVGTLGSITQRKVTEALSVKKHKFEKEKYPNMPNIWFEVLQPKARGKDQEEWAFEVASVESWGVPIELEMKVPSPEELKERQKREELMTYDDYFKSYKWQRGGETYTNIEKHLRQRGGITSNRKLSTIINTSLEVGIIYKDQSGKYHYNGLDKHLPDDGAEDLPFDKPDEEANDAF